MILVNKYVTVEPSYNEPLYNKVLGITNDFLYSNYCKIYYMQKYLGKTNPRCRRKNWENPLALCYIEVLLYSKWFYHRNNTVTE